MFRHRAFDSGRAPRSGRWRAAWLIFKVVQARLRFVAVLAAVGAAILYWPKLNALYEKWTRPLTGTEVAAASIVEYWCPMHPSVVQEKPGKCPICGMPLSMRKKGSVNPAEPLPAGVVSRVQLTPYREAVAGIRTASIRYQPLQRDIRTVGFVEFDERKLARINARVTGKSRIDKLYANVTGQIIEKGEPLAELYSPDLVVTVQNLLDAHRAGDGELERMAREKLQLWGIEGDQIDDILRSGRPVTHVTIRSPIRGHVIRKYREEGDYVGEGARLYDMADLSTVWIETQVYEDEIGLLQTGMPVHATTRALPNRTFAGRVLLIHPHLDAATRTLRVRFDMANPHHDLRPGMWTTVTLEVPAIRWAALSKDADKEQQDAYARGEVLAVPEQAVIDTGTRKLVYRQAEPDVYEGVEVQLGPRCGDFYPVLNGLHAGDQVATTGSFLIDAETRLTAGAGASYYGASGGPLAVHANHATMRPSTTRDTDDKIEQNLAQLSPADRQLAQQQRLCPVAGGPLGSMGVPLKITLQGQTLFVCCDGCRDAAEQHPEETLARLKHKEETSKHTAK